jgi:hypothetical protein
MFALRCALGLALMAGGSGCVRAATRPHPHKPVRARAAHVDRHAGETDCVAKYKNKCFRSGDEACAYAGCADQRCEVFGNAPAQVECADLR